MPVSLILGLEPAIDLASIVLRRFRRPAYSSHLAPIPIGCHHGYHVHNYTIVIIGMDGCTYTIAV